MLSWVNKYTANTKQNDLESNVVLSQQMHSKYKAKWLGVNDDEQSEPKKLWSTNHYKCLEV